VRSVIQIDRRSLLTGAALTSASVALDFATAHPKLEPERPIRARPSVGNLVWPRFSTDTRETVVFDTQTRVQRYPRKRVFEAARLA